MRTSTEIQHEIRIQATQLHELDVERARIIQRLHELEDQLRKAADAAKAALTEAALADFNAGNLERSSYKGGDGR